MMKMKVGWIDYANCTPLLLQLRDFLPDAGLELVHGVPARLNHALANAEIDICISSSIEYATHSQDYGILPGHCIGSDGPVMSVLLFSPCPVEELSGKRILVTPESATSVILLQILLSKYWGIPEYKLETSPFHWKGAIESGLPVLLIGDSALKASINCKLPYLYDLGESWKAMTGLPFVYALWQANMQSASDKPEQLSALAELLAMARDMMGQRLDDLAREASEKSWMGQEHLADYWRHITYSLDDAHKEGLLLYYSMASELSLAPVVESLNFYQV